MEENSPDSIHNIELDIDSSDFRRINILLST